MNVVIVGTGYVGLPLRRCSGQAVVFFLPELMEVDYVGFTWHV